MQDVQNNEVAIIQNSLEVLKTGPEILLRSRERKEKALTVGRNILAAIQENGMNAELDERAKNYLVKSRDALAEMKDQRAGVTQIMDQLKKMYTEVENDLDAKKAGTIPSQIQGHRDAYAKQQAEEAERKRREAEREAAKKKEAIEIWAYCEKWFANKLLTLLSEKKNRIVNVFNAITLETFAEKQAGLEKLQVHILNSDLEKQVGILLTFPVTPHHNADEVHAIRDQVLAEYDFNDFAINTWQKELTELRTELLDKLPSKKRELEEAARLKREAEEAAERARIEEEQRQKKIAEANAAEKKRLEAEAEAARKKNEEQQAELRRQQEEAERQRKEREEQERKQMEAEDARKREEAAQQADLKAQGEQTMTLFEKEAAIAEVEAPEARQGFDIQVLHAVGYTQLFAIWFEKVGKDLPLDKLGNTKLDQMKTWAEKIAHKENFKIDSKFLKYEP
ncbi:MAG: hypothetical protein KGO82_12235, partial [Bacteroidota bacterium]|nr:hypothetical protein [Bacteroidota bacterium]